jgi:membrane-associated protein
MIIPLGRLQDGVGAAAGHIITPANKQGQREPMSGGAACPPDRAMPRLDHINRRSNIFGAGRTGRRVDGAQAAAAEGRARQGGGNRREYAPATCRPAMGIMPSVFDTLRDHTRLVGEGQSAPVRRERWQAALRGAGRLVRFDLQPNPCLSFAVPLWYSFQACPEDGHVVFFKIHVTERGTTLRESKLLRPPFPKRKGVEILLPPFVSGRRGSQLQILRKDSMEAVKFVMDFVLHIDQHLQVLCANYGPWVYAILFLIVFCETGLVVTPILPGDSLLFAVGSMAAIGALDVAWVILILMAAAILGDTVNYSVGHYVGPKVFHEEHSRFLNKEYLHRTHAFYEKHGGKTIIIARFLPIIRTFAPFVAGIGSMTYPRFLFFNVTGGVLWVLLFVLAGYWFGNIPIVQKNFSMVIIALVLIPGIPATVEFIRIQISRRKKKTTREKDGLNFRP